MRMLQLANRRPHRVIARARPPRLAVLLGTLTATLASACGGGDGGAGGSAASADRQAAATPVCATMDTTPVSLAVLEFISKATPTPQRYLNMVGTDTAVPDDGFRVLQDKGPTYYYSNDPKLQQQVLDRLASAGPYTTLLVVYRGKTESDGGNTVDVRLGGHYVGGEHAGKVAATKRFQVRCDSTGWKIASTAEETVP